MTPLCIATGWLDSFFFFFCVVRKVAIICVVEKFTCKSSPIESRMFPFVLLVAKGVNWLKRIFFCFTFAMTFVSCE